MQQLSDQTSTICPQTEWLQEDIHENALICRACTCGLLIAGVTCTNRQALSCFVSTARLSDLAALHKLLIQIQLVNQTQNLIKFRPFSCFS